MKKIAQIPFSSGRDLAQLNTPEGAWDCHFHIFDPINFDYRSEDKTNIPPATVAAYRLLKNRLKLSNSVVVTPSAYGSDNRCTLTALTQLGNTARAVIVVDKLPSKQQMQDWHQQGVRGLRFMLPSLALVDKTLITNCANLLAKWQWHICFWMPADLLVLLEDFLGSLSCQIVFDHRASIPANIGINHAGFAVVSKLMKAKKAWVKISSVYQNSVVGAPTYQDNVEIDKAFIKLDASRVLWGSDWPHPSEYINKRDYPNDVQVFDLLKIQAEQELLIKQILVDNPRALYA